MTTYKDHALAFLSSRVSPEGLRGRADTWRQKSLAVDGLDVPAVLDRAAGHIEAMTDALAKVAELIEGMEDASSVGSAIQSLPIPDASIVDDIWAVGQALREDNRDPHGGSTASHLEMAADELRHLSSEAVQLRTMALEDLNRIRNAAFGAVGRLVTEPSHEAPALRM